MELVGDAEDRHRQQRQPRRASAPPQPHRQRGQQAVNEKMGDFVDVGEAEVRRRHPRMARRPENHRGHGERPEPVPASRGGISRHAKVVTGVVRLRQSESRSRLATGEPPGDSHQPPKLRADADRFRATLAQERRGSPNAREAPRRERKRLARRRAAGAGDHYTDAQTAVGAKLERAWP